MRIRPATVDDAAGIALAHTSAWRAGYEGLLPQDYLDGLDVAQWARRWIELLRAPPDPRRVVLVAQTETTIDGFAVVSPSRDENAAPEVGELVAINLARSAWGHGVGRALLAAATEQLVESGFERATLWVLAGNDRAIRLYVAAGWTPDGATKTDEIGGATVTELRYVRDLQ